MAVVDVRRTLTGEGSRSLGEPDGVVRHLLLVPGDLPRLMSCFDDPDPVVPMRAADALEKLCRHRPMWMTPHVDWLLDHVSHSASPAVRWHVAQILREIPLSADHRRLSVDRLAAYLAESRDLLVLTHSLETLTVLIREDPSLAGEVGVPLTRHLARLARCRVTSLARRAERLSRQLVDLGVPAYIAPAGGRATALVRGTMPGPRMTGSAWLPTARRSVASRRAVPTS